MSSNIRPEAVAEPLSLTEARDLLPDERRPYSTVFEILTGQQKARVLEIKRALGGIAAAHEAGALEPPLTPELADGVERACDMIESRSSRYLEDETCKSVGMRVLLAVHDHGYRRF